MVEVPRDRFALAVGVSGDIYARCGLGRFLYVVDNIATFAVGDIIRLKIVFEVNTKGCLREVPDMAKAGFDCVAATEIPPDRARLGLALDNHQRFRRAGCLCGLPALSRAFRCFFRRFFLTCTLIHG